MLGKWGVFLFRSLKRTIIGTILLTILVYINFFIMYSYEVKKQSDNAIYNSDLIGCDEIILSENIFDSYSSGNAKATKYMLYDLLEVMKEMDPVRKVYGFDSSIARFSENEVEVWTGYPETYELMAKAMKLQSGSWFSEEDDKIYCVVCGDYFAEYNVGDTLYLRAEDNLIGDSTGSIFTCTIAGKVQYPYYYAGFSMQSDTPSDIIYMRTGNAVFLKHDKNTVTEMESSGFLLAPGMEPMYVKYRDDATQDEIDTFRKKINQFYWDERYDAENIIPKTDLLEKKGDPADNLSFMRDKIFISVFILIITISSLFTITMIRSASADYKPKVKESATVFSMIMTIIHFATFPNIIGFIVMIYTESNCALPSRYMTENIKHEMLISDRFFELVLYFILTWILMILLSSIAPTIMLHNSYKSMGKTSEAYTYRPPEYYTGYQKETTDISDEKNGDDNKL